jgi:DNA-binding response OmpR family regulator
VDVLIAHTNEGSRQALAAALTCPGFTFVEAGDGARALEILMRDDPPRLALVEWDLPDVEGPELCRILRDFHLGRAPYVILLTPEKPDRDMTAGLVAGASDFVCTPASARELRARVDYGRHVVELPWGSSSVGPEQAPEAAPAAQAAPPAAQAELCAMLSDQWASALGV